MSPQVRRHIQAFCPPLTASFEAESEVAVRCTLHDGLCPLQLEARIEAFREARIPATREAEAKFLHT